MVNESGSCVAIARYDSSNDAVAKAVELTNGLKDLSPSDNILIKPNILWGASRRAKIPKYGYITTSRVVEDIIILLREMGCHKISIGEGCIANDELGSNTLKGFVWSGLGRVAKQYDVKLIDFNTSSYSKVRLGKSNVEVARATLEADFLIDVPVLKTHAITKISLGMKNLKGCLSMKSRKIFHMLDLNELIALLNMKVKPKLTVIDGLYAMERGPSASGRAHRVNLIIAGKDVFSCDIVGSAILGIEPKTVGYLEIFSEMNRRSIEIESVRVVGDKIADVFRPLEWEMDIDYFFRRTGIEGITVQFPGNRFCTNCVTCAEVLLACYCKDNQGVKVEPVEICFGAEVKAKKDSQKVMLIGNCAIRANKTIENAIKVSGCPPKIADAFTTVINSTLGPVRAKRILLTRLIKGILTKAGVYNEHFPREFTYNMPEFDPDHFK